MPMSKQQKHFSLQCFGRTLCSKSGLGAGAGVTAGKTSADDVGSALGISTSGTDAPGTAAFFLTKK